MIKAQVLQGGGRGRGTFDSGLKGSIQRVTSAADGERVSAKMLGHSLRTSLTAYGGPVVRQLYVVEDISPKEEWYVAITIDRERYCPILILSKKGGIDIETISRQSPEDVITIPLQYDAGINAEVLRSLQEQLAIPGSALGSLEKTLKSLWTIFSEKDATLLELNPLALLSSDRFMPLGAKFTFDDAAARRQPELFAMRDAEHEVAEEVEAETYGLVYVRLDGNIGNVVNGAGLAMATNDAIGLHGGASANFLDAGGQATKETMIQAFRIILADERVKAILVNIYGGMYVCARILLSESVLTRMEGITKCDMIAKSILGAASELGPITIPIVARLQGTNSAEGLRLVSSGQSPLPCV